MGCSPLFLSDEISWDSYIASQGRMPMSAAKDTGPAVQMSFSDLSSFLDSIDLRLRRVWNDVSEFVRAANIATQCKRSIDNELYQETMVSIHYRLANLCFDMDSINEPIRLALLAFASTLFLQWRGIKIRYEYLAQRLNMAMISLRHKNRGVPVRLALWIYIIAAISVLDERDKVYLQPALVEVVRELKFGSWDEVRLMLKSILWVDVLHDPLAKEMVEDTLSAPELSGIKNTALAIEGLHHTAK